MSEKEQNIILFLGKVLHKNIESVNQLEKYTGKNYRIALLTGKKTKVDKDIEKQLDFFIRTNTRRIDKVEQSLSKIYSEIAAIINHYENMMPLYSRLIPIFPYLKNTTPRSLQIANDKTEMRKVFKKYIPKNSPKFKIITKVNKKAVDEIVKEVGFPCVVKPASLAKSALVINTYYREELEKVLKDTSKKIKQFYKKNQVEQEPKMVVEELIEGDMYSIDGFVNSRGRIYYSPIIEIKTGKDIGHDDFFMYSQMTPSNLKKGEKEDVRDVVTKAIHAFGLRSSTAHVEFYITKENKVKILEIGARPGGFREEILYDGYGLNHLKNDILIHLGKKPDDKPKKKEYTVFLKFWPKKKGKLVSIKGFKKVSEMPFVIRSKQNKKPGDQVGFSKYGYEYICTFHLKAKTRAELLGNIRKVEKAIDFIVK